MSNWLGPKGQKIVDVVNCLGSIFGIVSGVGIIATVIAVVVNFVSGGSVVAFFGGGSTIVRSTASFPITAFDMLVHLIDVYVVAACPDDKLAISGTCNVVSAHHWVRPKLWAATIVKANPCSAISGENASGPRGCNYINGRIPNSSDLIPEDKNGRRASLFEWSMEIVPGHDADAHDVNFDGIAEATCVSPRLVSVRG